MDTPEERRRRLRLAALATTIIFGLVVHCVALGLNPLVRDMAGDALWAMMIFYVLGALLPRARLRMRTASALAICFGVEASQLYHSPRLDALRATLPGHLILGSGFEPRDFLSYSLGVVAAVVLENAGGRGVARRRQPAGCANKGEGSKRIQGRDTDRSLHGGSGE